MIRAYRQINFLLLDHSPPFSLPISSRLCQSSIFTSLSLHPSRFVYLCSLSTLSFRFITCCLIFYLSTAIHTFSLLLYCFPSR